MGTKAMGTGTPYNCDPRLTCITTLNYTNAQTPSIVASLAGSNTFDRCEMAFHYDCFGSVTWYYSSANAYADWIGNDGSSNYWEDAIDCGISHNRTRPNMCECDRNDHVWRKMEGNLTSGTYGWGAFPPSQFRNGDLGASYNERGNLRLGALRCHVAQ